ncbi:MAG: hypothetical protein ACJ748_06255 [Flavisolibacter sp.]|jgi:hypothetical protein
MKPIVTTLIIAGAVAGAYFLLKDNPKVKDVLNKAKDGASDALKKVNWNKVGTKAVTSLAEQA